MAVILKSTHNFRPHLDELFNPLSACSREEVAKGSQGGHVRFSGD